MREKQMKIRKRITIALLAALLLGLSACGEKTIVNEDGTETTQTEKGVGI